jgi:hypothetical protein
MFVIAGAALVAAACIFAIGWNAWEHSHPGREILNRCLVIAVPSCVALAIWLDRVGPGWAVVAALVGTSATPLAALALGVLACGGGACE